MPKATVLPLGSATASIFRAKVNPIWKRSIKHAPMKPPGPFRDASSTLLQIFMTTFPNHLETGSIPPHNYDALGRYSTPPQVNPSTSAPLTSTKSIPAYAPAFSPMMLSPPLAPSRMTASPLTTPKSLMAGASLETSPKYSTLFPCPSPRPLMHLSITSLSTLLHCFHDSGGTAAMSMISVLRPQIYPKSS